MVGKVHTIKGIVEVPFEVTIFHDSREKAIERVKLLASNGTLLMAESSRGTAKIFDGVLDATIEHDLEQFAKDMLGLEIRYESDGRCSADVDFSGDEDDLKLHAAANGIEVEVLDPHGPGGGWPELRITAPAKILLEWLKDYSGE